MKREIFYRDVILLFFFFRVSVQYFDQNHCSNTHKFGTLLRESWQLVDILRRTFLISEQFFE